MCERGKLPKDPILTEKSFNAQREKISALMKKKVQRIHANMRFPACTLAVQRALRNFFTSYKDMFCL